MFLYESNGERGVNSICYLTADNTSCVIFKLNGVNISTINTLIFSCQAYENVLQAPAHGLKGICMI